MTGKERRDLYQEVTDRITAQLDAGRIPWAKPWSARTAAGALDWHRNPASGTVYRGINPLLLEIARMEGDFSERRWLTFKQAKLKGGAVRKGETGTTIVFFKRLVVDDRERIGADGKPAKRAIFMLRHYTVFNVEQIDGLDLGADSAEEGYVPEELPGAQEILDGYFTGSRPAPPLEHGGNRAFYSPPGDFVQLPVREAFHSDALYFKTAYHEAIHSTGHASRLKRVEITGPIDFGSVPYGREELTAEMGAAMLCGVAGLEGTETSSAGYIQHWRDAIAGDNRMVILAAQRAQKAADLILGITPEPTPEPTTKD